MPTEKKPKRDTGKSYLERILEKLPAEKQTALKDVLLSDDIADLVGEGVLMKEEASRLVQEAEEEKNSSKRHYDEVTDWWEKKQARLAELHTENAELKRKVKGGGGDDDPETQPKPAPVALPPDLARKSDLAALEQQGAAYFNTMINLAGQHQVEFGVPLDVNKLVEHVRKVGVPVDRGGYDSFVSELRAEKQKKAVEAREAQIRKDEREKVLAEMSAPPLPTDGGTSPSFAHGTLRGLGKSGEKEFGVAAAVAGLNRRRAEGRSS
jgi:hypothetical protein